MKNQKGFSSVAVIGIIVVIIVVVGVAYLVGKHSSNVSNNYVPISDQNNIPLNSNPSNSDQGSANASNNSNGSDSGQKNQAQQSACTPSSPKSITLLSPVGGETYTSGQPETISWTSCNVDKVFISSAIGGHDMGSFSETPIPASQGSYQWIPNSRYGNDQHSGYLIYIYEAVVTPTGNTTSDVHAVSGPFNIN